MGPIQGILGLDFQAHGIQVNLVDEIRVLLGVHIPGHVHHLLEPKNMRLCERVKDAQELL
jgi:hypothetical protein